MKSHMKVQRDFPSEMKWTFGPTKGEFHKIREDDRYMGVLKNEFNVIVSELN